MGDGRWEMVKGRRERGEEGDVRGMLGDRMVGWCWWGIFDVMRG